MIRCSSRYLDLINVLAFDYHGGWEGKTGHHSPLFDKSADQGIDSISNVVSWLTD